MAELITTPTFTFKQGALYSETDAEDPITVVYYDGTISLKQEGRHEELEEVRIHPKFLDALFKEIKKHLPAAEKHLEKHFKKP